MVAPLQRWFRRSPGSLPAACLAALAVATQLCSCLPPTREPGCGGLFPEDAWLDIGGGRNTFEPLSDGDVLEVERGSQGGMHVWGSLQSGDIAPGPEDIWQGLLDGTLPLIQFTLTGPDGELTPDNSQRAILERWDDHYQHTGHLVVFQHFPTLPENWTELDFGEVEADMETRDHRLTASLIDRCGTTVTDGRTIRLDFPPRDEPVGR